MSRIPLMRLLVVAAIVGAIGLALLARDAFDAARLEAILAGLGLSAPLVFVLIFALGTVAFVPGSLFGLAGGAMFGPAYGAVWNLLGGTLGATLAFLAARYLASDWVQKRLGGKLETLVRGAEVEGWRFVALMRLVPVVPFNLLNYGLGLTRIRLRDYVAATFVCMMPGTAAYAWLGYAGKRAVTGETDAIGYGLAALALLAAIVFLPRLVRRVKQSSSGWITVPELRQQLSSGAALTLLDVRDPDEFVGPLGHIPGARNLPLPAVASSVAEIAGSGARPTVLVCRTDKRSAKAADVLRGTAMRDVRVLRGGMEAWNAAGAPVSRDAP